ncbi:hypothetical protein KCV87_02505 [Actinosynnema pretiosum subsp. pretiosum]|uniref:Uncharacterized protein n=1 Tax=Actinosynnema pretiosum subsp. pretiosum TaxID=103721 RepID=A0AA45L807_9PSEU|nr:hypothetical protein [Actinosynnema mirum]QUF05017.1 hypothetical protein KCV87_02505 [Actinosynnema pretiosum subsp. pretiosum]
MTSRWSTWCRSSGKHAQAVSRGEAEVVEVAGTLVRRTRHPRPLLRAADARGKAVIAELRERCGRRAG